MANIKNVLMVTYDCARADVIHRLRPKTYARLASRGVEFTRAISCAPLTPISHATIFTGRYPFRHGLRHLFRESLPEDVPTLAERLSSTGFQTGAIVSCPGLKDWYKMNRGFDHYDDWLPKLPDGRDPLSVPDVKLRGLAIKRAPVVADRAIDWISKTDRSRPWFLFVHFFDAHWPYEPPEDHGTPGNSYEGELTFADHYCGQIIDALDALGQLDDTLVVLQGDHGEDLAGWYANDKSGDGNQHPEEEGHGCCLYQQTQHVPLCFSHPTMPVIRLDTPVSLADLCPTILGLVGVEAPQTDGVDLSAAMSAGTEPHLRVLYAETMHPRELVANTGNFPDICNQQAIWLSPTDKVIRWVGATEGQDRYSAFDLVADPTEAHPIDLAPADERLAHFPKDARPVRAEATTDVPPEP